MAHIECHSLYAWIGEDELGSGKIGIKQANMAAGYIPIVTMEYDYEKITHPMVVLAMEAQAATWGKKIYLVRFSFDEIVMKTEQGQ